MVSLKKCIRFILTVIILIIFVFAPTVTYKRLNENKDGYTEESEYKNIIQVWHIDTFPGGYGSRKNCLNNIAKEYEKNNQGVLISVISQSVESANLLIKENSYPDIISYGIGVDIDVSKLLKVPSNFIGGKIDNVCYALPWARNDYFLIYNSNYNSKKDNISVGLSNYNLPNYALAINDYDLANCNYLSLDDAYQDFIFGKTNAIVGTLREVYRLEKRGISFNLKHLSGFTDMIQYISIYDKGNQKNKYSLDFLEYVNNVEIKKIDEQIGLMKVGGENSFESERLLQFEYDDKINTLSPFLGKNIATIFQNESKKCLTKNDLTNILKNCIL